MRLIRSWVRIWILYIDTVCTIPYGATGNIWRIIIRLGLLLLFPPIFFHQFFPPIFCFFPPFLSFFGVKKKHFSVIKVGVKSKNLSVQKCFGIRNCVGRSTGSTREH